MATRDLSNKRVKLAVGSSTSVANTSLSIITVAEANALLDFSPAVRWDGYDLGVKASDKTDDRSLTDDAGATIRGFTQFSGGVPIYYPKVTDTGSILRQTFNFVKIPRTEVIVAERVGWTDNSVAFAAGDTVNLYRMRTDGFSPDTAGAKGYAYVLNMLPKGDVNVWFVIPATTAAALTLVGAATASISVGTLQAALRGVTYQGQDITPRATWTTTDATVATVADGVITPIKVGNATVTVSYPGSAAALTVAVAVTA